MENDWPQEERNLANHQRFCVLDSSAQVYYKVKIAESQGKKGTIKLAQVSL